MGERQKEESRHSLQNQEDIEYGPGGTRGGRNRLEDVSRVKSPEQRKNMGHAMTNDAHHGVSNVQSISKDAKYEETLYVREHGKRSKRKFDRDHHLFSNYSGSDDAQNTEKQKLKRSDSFKRNASESSENDSQIDDKKDAKRRRKEERRLRKEEKRRMREERRRRRAERRAARQKNRTIDDLSHSSDFEKHVSDADDSDRDAYQRKNSHASNAKDAESEQKRLEIELRKRALESLRAKKAIND